MNLLYICSDFGIQPNGTKGASIHLRAITRALADQGHDVTLLSPHGAIHGQHPAKSLMPNGNHWIKKSHSRLREWLDSRNESTAIAREIRCLQYSADTGVQAVSMLGKRAPDAIIERLSLFGDVGRQIADALSIPFVVEINAILTDEARRFRGLHLEAVAESVEQSVLERADALMVVSNALADRLIQRGVEPHRIHVVPNGVDDDWLDAAHDGRRVRSLLGLHDAFVVGFVGSLKVWHGMDVAVRAFAKLHRDHGNARALIVGTGPEVQPLRRLTQELGIENAVKFTGSVDHESVPDYVAAMDVAVAPFIPMESFYFSPIKLFEYMAMQRCVLASNLGQIAEVIEDGVNGRQCEAGDVKAWHHALEELWAHPELRSRLGRAAAETVAGRYRWSHAAEKVLTLVETLVHSPTT